MNKPAKQKLDMITSASFERSPFFGSEIAEENARRNEADCRERNTSVPSFPSRVRLELTNNCNLNCVFCYRHHYRTDDKSILTPDDIDRLDPLLKSAKFISLQQKTESLMSPHIVEILDRVGKYDAIMSLNTNLLPLDEEMAEALVRNKVTFISVSISAFEDAYEKLFLGGKFDLLIEKVKLLNATKKRLNADLPRLRMSFVLRKDTFQNLDTALEFCKTHNFSEGIQVLSFFRHVEKDRDQELALDWSNYEAEWQAFNKRAEEMGVPIEFSLDVQEGMREKAVGQYVQTCFEPWESINIAPSGNVMPCTEAAEVMGNIRDTPIEEIWNNANFQQFRDSMNNGPYHKDCHLCTHCRHVSAAVVGEKGVKRNQLYDTYYRRRST